MSSRSEKKSAAAPLPVFYRRPRPLVAERDAGLSLLQSNDSRFAAGANSVPVVASEMTLACKHYPILFADGPVPQPVVLLGLVSGQNLFVGSDGAWEAGVYLPAYVRRYPFIFLESEDKSQYTLCIDEAAASVVEGKENPLFEEGEPTPITKAALDFCRDYQAHHAFTSGFVRALVEADLLIENRADATLKDGRKLSLSGFKVIDEARFNNLSGDQLAIWRQHGWLHLVYCHFISTSNWAGLVDRAAVREAG